jgi:hypothetical protein
MMQTLDQTNVDLQKKLSQLAQELPSDRLEQLVDFARFVLSLEERERSITRTPEQLKAIDLLFADRRPRGLYDALMLERHEERARDKRT